jgi:hypothetical protein
MASWIVHLRIAEKLLEQIPGLDAAQFAIGNVAPDSGVPDENWENFDPPSEITHFQRELGEDRIISGDLIFYQEYLENIESESDTARFSFLLGYFFHLVTDNLWRIHVFRPVRENYHQQFEDDPQFIWEVKRDWYGLDFAHVRADPGGIFWQVFLPAEYAAQYLDFFPLEAIPQQLEYIKAFYQRQDEEVEDRLRLSDNIYLTEKEMNDFVESAAQTILSIYEQIWNQGVLSEDQITALDLMGEDYAI